MKKLIAFIFLSIFLIQAFGQGIYYIDYLLKKQEYMKRCENKNRPQLHCDGKCLLMKKISEQQKSEQGNPPELKLAAKLEITTPVLSITVPSFPVRFTPFTFEARSIGSPTDRAISLLRPPDAA